VTVNEPRVGPGRRDQRRSLVDDGAPAHEDRIVAWLERVRGEYLEMPGLSLTEEQARRMWGLDLTVCRALLDALSQTGFLHRTEGGAYIRGDQASRPHAKSRSILW
jgi:hypothetical protein